MFKRILLAGVAATLMASSASSETLKFAFQGALKSLDPYTLNETFTLGTLGNVYEGLVRRGPDLDIQPALATSWEVVEPTRWRFHLRKGVKFHNGNDFTADDVVFSATRVRSDGSDLLTRIGKDVKVVKVDDHTVDFVLTGVNPILHFEWATWAIMDKEWTEANNATKVSDASSKEENHAAFNANGTGPFTIQSHDVGIKTVFQKNDAWWDTPQHNLDTVEFTPVGSDATRVAALLSGDLDMVYPVPVQDLKRVDNNADTRALTGPELRTIFLGMDQIRDELIYSNIKGKNPFKDLRVRQAVYHAINIEAIKEKVMRGLSTPSALMISPKLFSESDGFERLAYDVDKAKGLMADAGYGDGFEVGMDCPNDRYVNDEAICQAVASMLAKVGIKINLNAQPKSKYFAKVLKSGGYDTSFYLLGWTPGSLDSWNVLSNLHGCRDLEGNGAPFNLGGSCSKDIDALSAKILGENDQDVRNALIKEAYTISTNEVHYVPLHQQGLAWGVNNNIELKQRADNVFMFYYVNKK